MKKMALITLSLLVTATTLLAQNATKDLEKASRLMAQERLSLTIELVGFETPGAAAQPVGTVEMHRSGDLFYSRAFGEEFISRPDGAIAVNHEARTVLVMEEPVIDPKSDPVAANLDSLLTLNDSLVFAGMVDGLKTYEVYRHGGLIWRTDVGLGSDGAVHKLIYYYTTDEDQSVGLHHMELNYHYQSDEAGKEVYSMKRFVRQKNGSFQAVGPCEGYSVAAGH